MPAAIPSTAKPVVTVEETLMLSNGKSPVRINHRPSRASPDFFLRVYLLLPYILLLKSID